MTSLPRLLNKNLKEEARLHPLSLSITEKLVPLSFATLNLLREEMIGGRRYVELYTPVGSAGIFRSRAPQSDIGTESYKVELDHAIVEVGDYIIRGDISGEMTCRKAIQTIFEHYRGSYWKLGTVECTDTVNVDFEYGDNVLESINDVLSQTLDYVMSFKWSTTPWTVNIVRKDTKVTAEGRISRNIRNVSINSDDKDLCTRYYVKGLKSKDTYGYVNADTLSDYGIVEKADSGSDYTPEQAKRVAENYLTAHKKPKVSVEIDGLNLSTITGEDFDAFRPGRLFRLAIPSKDVVMTDVITTVAWRDVYNDPLSASVTLGDDRDPVIEFVKKTRKSGKSAAKQTKKKVKKVADDFEAKIDVESKRINLVVKGTGDNAKIKAAEIVLSINDSKSEAMISANKIKLDGNVDLNSVLYVGSGVAKFRKPAYFEGADRDVSINNGKVVAGGGVQIGANRNLVFLEGTEESQSILTITPTIAGNLIKSAEVSGNELKLTNVKGDEVTFSKAVASWVLGWSGGKFTATAKPQDQSVWTTIVQGTVSWDGNAATVPIEAYDSDNPSYQYATGRSVLVDATQRYRSGWAAAYAKVTLPAGGTAQTFEVKVPPSTVDGEAKVTTYELYEQNKNLILAKVAGTGGTIIASINHKQYDKGYDAGWGAAYGKVVLPGSSRAATFQVKTPPSTVDGSAVTTRYRLNSESDNTVAVSIVNDDESYSYTIATLNHKRYNAGYDSGWGAAYGKVVLPGSSRAATFQVKTPPSTVDGSAVTTRYRLSSENDNTVAVSIVDDDESNSYTIATLNHKRYNAGYDAGWAAAYGKVVVPGSALGANFSFKTPPSTVDGQAVTNNYRMYNYDNNSVAVRYIKADGTDGHTISKLTHGKYDAGIDSIDGDDITLQVYGTTPSGSSPSDTVTWTTLQSGKKHVNAYIWVKRSNGTWARLRSFSSTEP